MALSVTPLRVPRVVETATVAPPLVRLLPPASFSWTVIVEVLEPLATIEVGDALSVDWLADGEVLATKSTVAVLVKVEPLTVPLTVAVPALVLEVSVAVYVPLPSSVTALSVPRVVESATVSPPAARLLPFVSFKRTVTVEVLEPSAVIVVGAALIVEVDAEAPPGIVEMVGLVPLREPSDAVTVFGPTVDAVVYVTAATPLAFVADVPDESEPPPLDDQLTVSPLVATALPLASAS